MDLGFGSVEASGAGGTLGSLAVSPPQGPPPPIPAFLCPGSATGFLRPQSPSVALCFFPFASLFPALCLWGGFCLFLPVSLSLAPPPSHSSPSLSPSPSSPPSLSSSCSSGSCSSSFSSPIFLSKIHLHLDVSVALCPGVSVSLYLSHSFCLSDPFSVWLCLDFLSPSGSLLVPSSYLYLCLSWTWPLSSHPLSLSVSLLSSSVSVHGPWLTRAPALSLFSPRSLTTR